MEADGLIHGRITEESLDLMRRRIGFPSPTVRAGILTEPHNIVCSADAVRRYAISVGDDNPMYRDAEYAKGTRWGGVIAPPGFDSSMGLDRSRQMDLAFAKETSKALRGVHLFHSGSELFFHRPLRDGTVLYKAGWVSKVETKKSSFGGTSAIVTNSHSLWDGEENVTVTGDSWFVHAERRPVVEGEKKPRSQKEEPALYTDAQIEEIEAAYDAEYQRGADTLYIEDVKAGDELPLMVKGPITITDLINSHMGGGWYGYGNPPYRLAHENRKKLRGFYARNEYNAWDTLQRIHWDGALARQVGVAGPYDIGPMRRQMICHYCTNYAGDDAWIYRVRYELRRFNFMGDTTWIRGRIRETRVDPALGPLLELEIRGVNQRGDENITGEATILVASRATGRLAEPPAPPPMTPYRS